MKIYSDRTTADSDSRSVDVGGRVGLRPISRAEIHRVLENERRREVVRCLLAGDGPVAVQTLVGRLADAEYDATAVTTLHELRQRVHVSLSRTHLPVLEEHGLVAYDRPSGTVSRGANLTEFESILNGDALDRPITVRSGDDSGSIRSEDGS